MLECAVETYPDLVLRKEDEGVWEKDPRSCPVGESDRDVSWSQEPGFGSGWGSQAGWGKFKLKRGEGEEGDIHDWGSMLGDWGSDSEQHDAVVIPLSASSSIAGWVIVSDW